MKVPSRIIALTEETTELIYLLNQQDRLCGISAYTVRPSQAKKEKPIVSAFISGHIKRIQDLKPDLIIGFSDIQADLARELIKLGLNVLILNQRSVCEIFDAMLMIGSLMGCRSETQMLIDEWKAKLDLIHERNQNLSKPKVFFQEWDEPIISGIEWVSELISVVGAEDIFNDLPQKSMAKDRIVTVEDVAAKNPDAIIGSWCGKPVNFDWIKNQKIWQGTAALKRNQLFEMDPSIILQPGPALFLEGVDELQRLVQSVRDDS